ncbi:MAG: T9SS type A sorting domain-containing protein [Ferruginibacter sp.]
MKHLFLLSYFALICQIIFAQDPAYPPAPAAPGNITTAEYFFDTDPGLGNGIPITVSPAVDIINISFSANVSALGDGNHILFIRSKDDWSITSAVSFLKGAPLPVQLLSFTGIKSNGSIQLKWMTENEINASHFIIERSVDGVAFATTGEVVANNRGGKNEYGYTDAQPVNGINFYRLKQTDIDGRFSYSPVIRILNNTGELILTLSPNPAKNFISITYPGKKEMLTISIYDVAGRLVKKQTRKNVLPLIVTLQSLGEGMYFIQVSDGETVQKGRFVKH